MRPWFVFLILFAFPAGCLEDGVPNDDLAPCPERNDWREVLAAAARLPPGLVPTSEPAARESDVGQPLFQAAVDNGGFGGEPTQLGVTTWTTTGWVIHEAYFLHRLDGPAGARAPGGCSLAGRMVPEDAWPTSNDAGVTAPWAANYEIQRQQPVFGAAVHPSEHARMIAALDASNITDGGPGIPFDDGPQSLHILHEDLGNATSSEPASLRDLGSVLQAWLLLP